MPIRSTPTRIGNGGPGSPDTIRIRDEFDRRTEVVLTVTGAQVNRRRGLPALLAPETRKDLRERPVPAVPQQHADWQDRYAAAAIQLKPALGPVG
jgi:hypothetical protein